MATEESRVSAVVQVHSNVKKAGFSLKLRFCVSSKKALPACHRAVGVAPRFIMLSEGGKSRSVICSKLYMAFLAHSHLEYHSTFAAAGNKFR